LYNILAAKNVYNRGAAADGGCRAGSRGQGPCEGDVSKEASIAVPTKPTGEDSRVTNRRSTDKAKCRGSFRCEV
jgi:hypothetical protein